VERNNPDPARRVTTVRSGASTPGPAANPGRISPKKADNRRIVGVFVSYTWRPEGELYPVREGRTHIGSGKIKDDPEHRDVEVQCSLDQMVSADHALILVRRNEFFIQDLASTNGTFLNGKLLRPGTVEDLPNEAEIKVGKTVFNFVRFKSEPATETPTIKVEVEEERPRSRRDATKFDWPSS
jgi:pSer/pThr/pTyr-binding forkhead associated (FHA) protein